MISNPVLGNQLVGSAACDAKAQGQVYDPTIRENIDAKIAQLKAALAELEASKESLAPLLDMKISQLRNAMMY